MGIISYLFVGLIVGAIARTLVSGPHRLGCLGTSVLGVLGAIVGGTVLNVLGGDGFELSGAGFLGSVFGAVIILVVAKKLGGSSKR